jgi:hypothetical protein
MSKTEVESKSRTLGLSNWNNSSLPSTFGNIGTYRKEKITH